MTRLGPCPRDLCREIIDLNAAYCPHCGCELDEMNRKQGFTPPEMTLSQKLVFDLKQHHAENEHNFVKGGLEKIIGVRRKVQDFLKTRPTIRKIADGIEVLRLVYHWTVNGKNITETLPNLMESIGQSIVVIKTAYNGKTAESYADFIEHYLVLIIVLAGMVSDFLRMMGSVVVGGDPRIYWNEILATLGIIKNQFPTSIDDPEFYQKIYNILQANVPPGCEIVLSLLAAMIDYCYRHAPAYFVRWISEKKFIIRSVIMTIVLAVVGYQFLSLVAPFSMHNSSDKKE